MKHLQADHFPWLCLRDPEGMPCKIGDIVPVNTEIGQSIEPPGSRPRPNRTFSIYFVDRREAKQLESRQSLPRVWRILGMYQQRPERMGERDHPGLILVVMPEIRMV